MEEAEVPAKGKNLAISLSITNDEYIKFSTEMDEITWGQEEFVIIRAFLWLD